MIGTRRLTVLLSLALATCGHGRGGSITIDRPCGGDFPQEVDRVWTPGRADIEAIEQKLSAALEGYFRDVGFPGKSAKGPSTKLKDYQLRYHGLVQNGQTLVRIVGFNSSILDDETTSGAGVHVWPSEHCDGSWFQFSADFDPQAQSFANFALSTSAFQDSGLFPDLRPVATDKP